MASFQNIQGGAAEAGAKLTKGILGETENLKTLGIVVNQGTKEFKAQVKAIMANRGVTEQQAKVINIFTQATLQSKNAIGDFARTQGSAANQMKIAGERLKNLREKFGTLLLPIVVKVTGALIKFVDFLAALPKPVKIALLVFAGLAAVLGPLLLILGLMAQAFLAIKTAAIVLGPIIAGFGGAGAVALAVILAKVLLVIAAIVAIGAVIALVIDDFKVWASGGESMLGKLLGSFENFKAGVMEIFNAIKAFFVTLWTAVTTNSEDAWSKFLDSIINLVVVFGKLLFNIWKFIFFTLPVKVIRGGIKIWLGLFTAFASRIKGLFLGIFNKLGDGIVSAFDKVKGLIGLGDSNVNVNDNTPARGLFDPTFNSGLSGRDASNVQSQNINVDSKVTIQIPEGTSEEQARFLQQDAGKMVDEKFNAMFGGVINGNQRNEQ